MEAILVDRLVKDYGRVRALDGVSFSVKEGEIFGLLGPNGAGKTTTIKVLTTLTRPTAGSARVLGHDVVEEGQAVREAIGFVPQAISADGDLTGYENLLIFSKLAHVPREERQERIRMALEQMGLLARANDLVKRYSGGMMRRLEIAQALVNRPRVLILDEPTIGLDPASRRQVWEHIRQLRQRFGMTVLLTTHDMAEAEALCERIAIMDRGKVVVMGSPEELKGSLGGELITVRLSSPVDPSKLDLGELAQVQGVEGNELRLLVKEAEAELPRIMAELSRRGYEALRVSFRKPSLDDVFLKYAGRRLEEASTYREARALRRIFQRYAR